VFQSRRYDIELRDISNVEAALIFALSHLRESFGSEVVAASQIILIVDGYPPPENGLSFSLDLLAACPPVHSLAVGEPVELAASSPYNDLATRTQGECCSVPLPANAGSVKLAFDELFTHRYKPYRGLLVLGHSCVGVFTDPDANFNQRLRAHTSLPPVLAVRAFVPLANVQSAPAAAKMSLYPTSMLSESSDVDMGQWEQPHLLALLREALATERCAAVISLGHGGVGLVTATAATPSRSSTLLKTRAASSAAHALLLLTVLPPGASGAGWEQLRDLTLGRPLVPPPAASPETVECQISGDALQSDLQRLARLLRGLPAKREQAMKEVDKLATTARVYRMPSVLSTVQDVLQGALAEVPPAAQTHINTMLAGLGPTS